MTRHDRLAELIADAVADVEPEDRLAQIRARTSTAGSPRRWWAAAGGSALAVAAAVTAVAVVGSDPPRATDPGPAEPPGNARAVAAYFVGQGPDGPRLYREFQRTEGSALDLLESGPDDPDYTSLWPAGSLGEVSELGGEVLSVAVLAAPTGDVALAEQQLVYTLRAERQDPDLQVDFDRGDDIVDPVSAAPPLEVLSHANLSDPSEGQVADEVLHVRGVANSYEANVLWRIEGTDLSGFFSAAGWMEPRLFPFSGDVDVSSLDPGRYTLIVETDDPTGGAEGIGSFTDSRSFVIE